MKYWLYYLFLIFLFFASDINTAGATLANTNQQKKIKYNIILTFPRTNVSNKLKSDARRFCYEAILSTNTFNIQMTPYNSQQDKQIVFVVTAQLNKQPNSNIGLTLSLYRLPQKVLINQIRNNNIPSNKARLIIRQAAYQLFYGKLYNEEQKNHKIIPLFKYPPKTQSLQNKKSYSPILEESQDSSVQTNISSYAQKKKPLIIKKKQRKRKQRKNTSSINKNYNAPNITQRKKILPNKKIIQIWHKKFDYSLGYSQLNIASSSQLLITETTLKTLHTAIFYTRKTLSNYTNYTFHLSLEKTLYKLDYKVPLLFDFGYRYNFRIWSEILMLSPIITYSKGYFINLIYFGEKINVLPLTTIWTGAQLSVNTALKLIFQYSIAFMGSVNYHGITSPLTGQKSQFTISTKIYKAWGIQYCMEHFSIQTELGKTTNKFNKFSIDLTYKI